MYDTIWIFNNSLRIFLYSNRDLKFEEYASSFFNFRTIFIFLCKPTGSLPVNKQINEPFPYSEFYIKPSGVELKIALYDSKSIKIVTFREIFVSFPCHGRKIVSRTNVVSRRSRKVKIAPRSSFRLFVIQAERANVRLGGTLNLSIPRARAYARIFRLSLAPESRSSIFVNRNTRTQREVSYGRGSPVPT